MDRTTLEALRDLPGKTIETDIRFVRRSALAPVLVAEGIRIPNDGGVELMPSMSYSEIIGSKAINVYVPGLDPSAAWTSTPTPTVPRDGRTSTPCKRSAAPTATSPTGWSIEPISRKGFIDDVLRLYRVEQDGGQLVLSLASLDELVPGLVSLGQACIRVADLVFTKRSAMVAAFTEQVEVFDDRADVYRQEDIRRLQDVSQLVAFSDRQTLRDLIAA